ncbi:MAG: murein hydrolase activator EnvC family protein [Actinomycetota bacterium]
MTSWRGRLAAVLGSVVAVLPTLGPTGAATGAEPSPSRDHRIEELESAIGEASAEEASALRELSDIRGRRRELDAAVGALDHQILDVEGRIRLLRAAVDQLTSKALTLDARAEAANLRRVDSEQRASDAVAELYRTEGGVAVLDAVLDADSLRDAQVGSHYLVHIADDRRIEVVDLANLTQTIENLEAEASAQRDTAEATRAEAAGEREQLAGLRADQAAARDEIARQESREQALLAEIRERRDDYTAELAALQATSNAITEMLSTRQRGQSRAASFSVARPVPGSIGSGFGTRVHPVYGDTRMHNGVDMNAGHGAPIRAGAAGIVAWSGPRQGYGNTVIIDHGNQYATLYAHASALHVTTGDRVEAGATLASVGATGLATGPHLHFEVRLLGVPVNPVNFM